MMPVRPTIVCVTDGSPESGQLTRISALAELLGADLAVPTGALAETQPNTCRAKARTPVD